MLKTEIQNHLETKLIPFWKNLCDKEHGGFYGYMDFNGTIDKEAVKGCILNSRILWFFSNAAKMIQDDTLINYADHAYEFMKSFCFDSQYGGIYWSVTFDGKVKEDIKHTYNQAFAIYAVASYYDVSGKKEALEQAFQLYELIEKKCKDEKGYLEAFSRDFQPVNNEKLSENGVMAEKTMNTLLHVFEAYTELYRVSRDERVEKNLRWMLEIFETKVYNPKLHRQEVFFDKDWNSLIDLHSYGHDIETAWLIDRGCEIVGDENLTARMEKMTKDLTECVYKKAYHNHSVWNECEKGVENKNRIWWVQAEAIVGFLNGYEKEPDRTEYRAAAEDIWQYIKENIIDPRENSEWFWYTDENGNPAHKPIVEPWKCPYHNGRMCLEVIRRL